MLRGHARIRVSNLTARFRNGTPVKTRGGLMPATRAVNTSS